jgi:hypothetical protein
MKKRVLGVFLCFAILISLFSDMTPIMAGSSGSGSAFDDTWHWANPQPQGNDLRAVTYGGGRYAAVGKNGTVLTSTDNVAWTSASSDFYDDYNTVAYGNHLFVVGGNWGYVGKSTDGIDWTYDSSATSDDILGIAFGNGTFVAVGSGYIMTSSDGGTWTLGSDPDISGNFNGVAYTGGYFIAVGDNGRILYSSNGLDWETGLNDDTHDLFSVTYGDGGFVAVGRGGAILTAATPDAVWTKKGTIYLDGGDYTSDFDSYLYSAAYANGAYIIASESMYLTSTDGTNWTITYDLSNLSALYGVVYGDDGFAAAGAGGLIISIDGDDWTERSSGSKSYLAGLTYNNGLFVAVGSNEIMTSLNGAQWIRRAVPGDVGTLEAVVGNGSGGYAAAGYGYDASHHYIGTLVYSMDGTTWQKAATVPGTDMMLKGAAYGNGKYVAVGSSWSSGATGVIYTSADGSGWYQITTGLIGRLTDVIYENGMFVAVGENDTLMYSADGTSWTTVSRTKTINSGSINYTGIAYGEGLFVAVGGNGEIVKSLDGTAWEDMEKYNGSLSCITYGSGYFVTAGQSGLILRCAVSDGAAGVWERTGQYMTNNRLNATAYGNGVYAVAGDDGTILYSGSAAPIPVTANAANNTVSVNPASVTAGSTATITAAGDRQSAAGSVTGDERYVPTTWTSTEAGKNGAFTVTGSVYTSDYTTPAAGSYTITATFQKQTWNGSAWNNAAGSTDTKTTALTVTAVSVPTTANTANNTVSVSPASVTVGASTTITAAGDRQSIAGAVYGDERYVPTAWISTEAGKNGTFTLSGGSYTSIYTTPAAGSYTITATFQKQVWDGSTWNDAAGLTDTKTAALTANSSGGGDGSGGNTGGGSTGDNAAAGTSQTGLGSITVENGTSTATMDSSKLAKELSGGKPGSTIVLTITGNANKARFNFTVADLKAIADNGSMLRLEAPLGIYELPATEIDFDSISKQYPNIAYRDIRVTVAFSIADGTKAKPDGAKILGQPVSITVSLVAGGKEIELDEFTKYVERDLPVPDGPGFTAGAVIEKDGVLRPVPTKAVTINGKKYAAIFSRTNSVYALASKPVSFDDMKGHWAREAANDLASRLVINGVGNNRFAPDRDITRTEFAAIIVRALGLKASDSADFTDVKAGSWYCGAVAAAYKYGIVSGYGGGAFRPDSKITRQEAMAMTARAMKVAGMDTAITEEDTSNELAKFMDGKNFSNWARQPAAAVIRSGLAVGSEGYARPEKNITRAETAAIVRRLLEKAGLI